MARRSAPDPLVGRMDANQVRRRRIAGVPVIAAFVVVLIVAAMTPVFPWVFDWFFIRFEGPVLQREFSFEGSWVEWPGKGETASFSVYTITSVDPDGILGRAGIQAGDIPIDGFESGFLHDLESVKRGCEAEVQVVSGYKVYDVPKPTRSIRLFPQPGRLCPAD